MSNSVVDPSGSIAGAKIALLRQILIYITEQLNDLDRLAIISFNDCTYDRSIGLERINQQNQQILKHIFSNEITSGGGTHIGSGLQRGIDLFTNRGTENPVGALLLLTDGQDAGTHGYTQLMQTLPAGVVCHTFSNGCDHETSLLIGLAEKDQEQSVVLAFAMALGGLFSCIAQQLQIDIEFNGEYRIIHVHLKYKYEPEKLPSNKIKLKLTDPNADEKRNLVFQLHVPRTDIHQNIEMPSEQLLSNEQNIGQATVNYTVPNSGRTIAFTSVPVRLIQTVQPAVDLLQVNYTLDIQRNQEETAHQMKRAMNENDVQRSLAILKAEVEKIKASVSAQDPFCQLLIKDLEQQYPTPQDYYSSHNNTYIHLNEVHILR